ncbi:hypothetical protein ACGFNU_00965 [Spirillospora sp. NPDC048911]|uniref:hypothetical protein n=1 Tax=Spirillospora sp. NPDC048911 TaxID=3364527 RepID=UPI003718EFD4
MTATYDTPSYGTTPNANGQHPAVGTNRYGRPVQVYNLRYLPKWLGARNGDDATADKAGERRPDRAGAWLLATASVLLLLLAIAQGYVSFRAQYAFVHAEKGEKTASMLEALGLDAAAVIFALLALAQARLGRPAVAERVLNLACVGGSLAMNALSADPGSVKSLAAWILPAALYAAASDRLIAVVRRRALAGRPGADDDRSPLAAAGALALWGLRLGMAPVTTVKGFRAWVLDEAPIAPGRRAITQRDLPALPAPDSATTADTRPAAVADNPSDTTTDTDADNATADAAGRRSDERADSKTGRVSVRKSAKRSANKSDKTTARARALLAANPEMSGADLGRRLKVSERTGSRLRARLLPEVTAAPIPADSTPTAPTTLADSTGQGGDA